MKTDIESLVDKSPRQLIEIKSDLLSLFRFQEAKEVQDYINHCISTSRTIKKILRA